MAKIRSPKAIEETERKALQDIADKQNTTIISFVAPYGVRTSPVTFSSASIEEPETYRLEKIVAGAKTDTLHLVIHTPGGEMHTAYKIAMFLRSKFKKIVAFVPYEAASGGTILCCAANEVHISDLGNLTSFDPQVMYKGQRVSAYAFERAVDHISNEYGEVDPREIPPPWQQMADKIDPIIYDEMSTALFTSMICANRLLTKAGYNDADSVKIVRRLGRNSYTHGMPIFGEEAKEIGFNVKNDEKDAMEIYRKLVSTRLNEQSPRHLIDHFYPATASSEINPTPAKKRTTKRRP